jgi:hypothetical protein
MKTLLIVISFFYLSCSSNSSIKTNTTNTSIIAIPISDTFKLNCDKPNIERLIVRSDTTFDYNNYEGHTIKSFDNQRRLRKLFISNLFESNSKSIYSSTAIYDTAGHIIYEDKTMEFIRWHCYCYKYDPRGHLIFKEGYSSGEMGIRETYMYQEDKLVKKITERLTGQVEKVY